MEAKQYQNASHESTKKSTNSHRPIVASTPVINDPKSASDLQAENWFKKTNAQLNELEYSGEKLLKQGRRYLSQLDSLIRGHPLTALVITSAATAVTVYAVMKFMGHRTSSGTQTVKS